jgi:uncharacterized protein YllA (UPF0747 family)
MDFNCNYISYQQTGFFSKIVTDYLAGESDLQSFYQHLPNKQGIKDAITAKKSTVDRNLLVNYFKNQYSNTQLTTLQQQHIDLLQQENCFTITTAHQPNIFTGPLYFIYKMRIYKNCILYKWQRLVCDPTMLLVY